MPTVERRRIILEWDHLVDIEPGLPASPAIESNIIQAENFAASRPPSGRR
jgi:hypothetical protein